MDRNEIARKGDDRGFAASLRGVMEEATERGDRTLMLTGFEVYRAQCIDCFRRGYIEGLCVAPDGRQRICGVEQFADLVERVEKAIIIKEYDDVAWRELMSMRDAEDSRWLPTEDIKSLDAARSNISMYAGTLAETFAQSDEDEGRRLAMAILRVQNPEAPVDRKALSETRRLSFETIKAALACSLTDALERLEMLRDPDGYFRLTRVVACAPGFEKMGADGKRHFGACWAHDASTTQKFRSGAFSPYKRNPSHQDYVITADVSESCIDWNTTLFSMLYHGDFETEIRLLPGAEVDKVISVDNRDEPSLSAEVAGFAPR